MPSPASPLGASRVPHTLSFSNPGRLQTLPEVSWGTLPWLGSQHVLPESASLWVRSDHWEAVSAPEGHTPLQLPRRSLCRNTDNIKRHIQPKKSCQRCLPSLPPVPNLTTCSKRLHITVAGLCFRKIRQELKYSHTLASASRSVVHMPVMLALWGLAVSSRPAWASRGPVSGTNKQALEHVPLVPALGKL